jgi:hypothetical protein
VTESPARIAPAAASEWADRLACQGKVMRPAAPFAPCWIAPAPSAASAPRCVCSASPLITG